MKKRIGFIIMAAMMAMSGSGAHAAKVCVSPAQFESIYNSVILSKNTYYCSTSSTSRTGGNGQYCWCFASGSWSWSGNDSGNYCTTYCPGYCGV
jgi:hypothetical protein